MAERDRLLDQQKQLYNMQDETLEMINNKLDKIKIITVDIGTEVKAQNKDLDNLQQNIDIVKNQIENNTKKTDKIIEENKNTLCLPFTSAINLFSCAIM